MQNCCSWVVTIVDGLQLLCTLLHSVLLNRVIPLNMRVSLFAIHYTAAWWPLASGILLKDSPGTENAFLGRIMLRGAKCPGNVIWRRGEGQTRRRAKLPSVT